MRLSAIIFVVFFVIGLSGCATTTDIEAVRALAEQANAKAETALKTSEEAKAASMSATGVAEDALATAQDAKAMAEATDSKIDRMFEKTMKK